MQELGGFPIFASILAGILTFISPCILPLIPVYITLVTGLSVEELDNRKNLLSILLSAVCFVLGFTTVFVFLGLSVTIIGQFFLNNIDILRTVGGIIIIIFGLHLLGIFKIKILYKQFGWMDKIKRTSNYFTIYLIGCAFAFSWTPCVDPILASILIMAATQGTIAKGTFLLLIYSLGLAIPFILTALFVSKFLTLFNSLKKYYKVIEIVSGTLLILMGILVISGGFNKITINVMKILS
ncbi:MAG: sulfite exporter TauE/SafE family protein [Elusimicrobia bacterium]|nr:sulfite exporter TauE/SafE family protein [Elusimicrobiota bacterium]MBR4633358.1 sulfite exporter TauE/SafE family protein [Elusimicrobiota bacterium]